MSGSAGASCMPGLGFGGGCLPKDIRAFMARAGELGVDQALSFLREVDAINLRRRARWSTWPARSCGGTLAGVRVAIWGRRSSPTPTTSAIRRPSMSGCRCSAQVRPSGSMTRRRWTTPGSPTQRLAYASSAVDAAGDADVVLHLTEWTEFREMDPSVLADVVKERRIVDGRNALDRDRWRSAGWTYRALGRT